MRARKAPAHPFEVERPWCGLRFYLQIFVAGATRKITGLIVTILRSSLQPQRIKRIGTSSPRDAPITTFFALRIEYIQSPSAAVMSVEVLTTVSPVTNQPILTRNGLSDSEVALLPVFATQAFNEYRLTSLEQRQAIVKNALHLLNDRRDVLARELTEQMGRPIAYTAQEITTAVARGEYLLKISDEALRDTDGEPEKGFKRYIRKAPLGPVLIIFAWNVGSFLLLV